MQEQQEQQKQAGAADKAPHPPFRVDWRAVVRYSAVIDPSLPQFAGLTPADFPHYGTARLTDQADDVLDKLEVDDNAYDVQGREVCYVTLSDGTGPARQGNRP